MIDTLAHRDRQRRADLKRDPRRRQPFEIGGLREERKRAVDIGTHHGFAVQRE
jgi:hypothetical protein